MKIYTRSGDDGETGLLGGLRVSKTHPAIEVCGTLDETNSWLGMARAGSDSQLPADVDRLLTEIQSQLFDLGSRVAACLSETGRVAEFPEDRVVELEAAIDRYDANLPQLTAFILPSGCRSGCDLHMARAVCRRAERQLVSLAETGVTRDLKTERIYLNRLADLLFVLARTVNAGAGQGETNWTPSGSG